MYQLAGGAAEAGHVHDATGLAAGAVTAAKLGYAVDSVVVVQRGATATASGANLVSAYTAAKALTPGGNALAATNRACVLIPPGSYDLDAYANGLEVDTDFVDLVGLAPGNPAATTLAKGGAATGAAVTQTANDTWMVGFTVEHQNNASGCHALNIQGQWEDDTIYDWDVDGDELDCDIPLGQMLLLSTDGGSVYEIYHCTVLNGPPISRTITLDRTTGVTQSVKVKLWASNVDSAYRDMRFLMANPTSATEEANGWAVHGEVDIRGSWTRCYGNGWAWRVHPGAWLNATMTDVEAGYNSLTGDGSTGETGGAAADSNGCRVSGIYRNVKTSMRSMGGGGSYGCDVDAELYDCQFIGSQCGAIGKVFSGTAENCLFAGNSFGVSGTISGTLRGCVNTMISVGPMNLAAATLDGCTFKQTASSDVDAVSVEDSASTISRSVLIASGTGKSIGDDGSARDVVAFGNFMNGGLGANVTNTVTNHGNQIDTAIDIS